MTIGQRIKNRRIELGLTQDDFAKRMGLSAKSTICKLEREGDNITTDRIRKIAKALECTPAYLMGWEESESNSITVSIESDSKNTLPSAAEIDLIRSFRAANDEVKRMVLYLLKLSEPNK